MTIVRKIIATVVAAGALAVGVGIVQADAAPVTKSTSKVSTQGGGQGEWPTFR